MTLSLQDEGLSMYRQSVRGWLQTEFAPNIEAWRDAGLTPRDLYRRAGEQGLLCPGVPEEYGGAGCSFLYNAVVNEEIVRLGVAPSSFVVHSDIVANYLLRWGTEEQKSALLPAMVDGSILTGIAMTEPGAGSDLQGVRMTATRVEGGYRLNGQKTFITNGQNADLLVVVAKTDANAGARGISLFLVPTDSPGFERGRNLKKMGSPEQDTSELFFNDVFVPEARRLGAEGEGFAILMSELPTERLTIAIWAVAACETALALTIDYVKTRRAFGKPLIEFQNTAFKLAELKAKIRMSRRYLDSCVQSYLADDFTAVDGAEAKLVTTELQCKVMDECLQLHGGYGWMDEYPISRMFTEARVQRIYGGSDEIMKLIISRSL